MSEYTPFTTKDGQRIWEAWTRCNVDSNGNVYKWSADVLNSAFPEGKAVPKTIMRTTSVTAEECHELTEAESGASCYFIAIERLLGGYLTGYNFANILALKSRRVGNKSQDWADAINGTFGLTEPEPPLVTLEELIEFFSGVHFNEETMEAHRVRLEKIVRSKLPKADA